VVGPSSLAAVPGIEVVAVDTVAEALRAVFA